MFKFNNIFLKFCRKTVKKRSLLAHVLKSCNTYATRHILACSLVPSKAVFSDFIRAITAKHNQTLCKTQNFANRQRYKNCVIKQATRRNVRKDSRFTVKVPFFYHRSFSTTPTRQIRQNSRRHIENTNGQISHKNGANLNDCNSCGISTTQTRKTS